jgi:uncharacterized protein (DUF1800 family)
MRQALSLIPRTSGRLALAGIALLAAGAARPLAAAVFDLNGDGKSDIVVRNVSTGANRVLFVNGTQVTSEAPLPPITDRDYVMAALADFNLDGRADLLWRHQASGERFFWAMNGANVSSTTALGQNVDTDWRIAGVGQMGGDARADVVWRHEATGEHVLWVMTATGPSAHGLPAETDLGWRIAGIADANGDGWADIYWRHRDGRNRIWLMGDGVLSQSINLPPRDIVWQFVGVGDYDQNGAADILWRHPVTGKAIIWFMSGPTIIYRSDELFVTHGGEWQPEMVADYNGDGKSDILWRHQTTGAMQIWLMSGKNRIGLGDVPTPGAGFQLAGKAQPPASASVFLATLIPEGAANTPAAGSSTIVLAPDGLSAKITLNFTNLSAMQTAAHVHGPADAGTSAPPLYSVPMGSFGDVSWIFEPTAGLTVADQVDALKTGRLYINVHSTNYPNGEIRGQYRITAAGGVEPPIPNPPPPGPPTPARAHRFLQQATMGATPALVAQVQAIGYDAFIEDQFNQPMSGYTVFVETAPSANDGSKLGALRSRFYLNAISGPDQLRQRVAFALSQMLVTSTNDVGDGRGMARYQDILARNAFGNVLNLLYEVTLDPIMGAYLDMANNDKPNPATGKTANENFARELLQLFSIGLYHTWPSGALKIDAAGAPIPTYDQPVIEEMARVFTGWTYNSPTTPTCTFNCQAYYLAPMKLSQNNHDIGQKSILNNVVLPPGQSGLDDLGVTMNTIVNHPAIAPFFSRQLIQHLVTSNPSKGYVARVSKVFENDGTGVRGNLRAVVKAILLDVEARRDPDGDPNFGRALDPALFITQYVRGMGATGQGYGLAERSATLEQQVFGANTVFNFYQPDFQVPGTTILGPPLQVYTESNAVRRSNLVNQFIYQTTALPNYAPSGSTTVSFTAAMAPYIASAGNPGGMVDLMADRLMPGRMSPSTRQVIVNAVTATPANDPTNRARTALYLIATSPAFNVNR